MNNKWTDISYNKMPTFRNDLSRRTYEEWTDALDGHTDKSNDEEEDDC